MKKISVLAVLFICCFQLLYAQPGRLDPSFGNNGVVTTALGKNYTYGSSPVGKILLLSDGSMYIIQGYLLKRHADGSVDESFGVNGSTRDISLNLNSAAIQADGKIVVAGAGNIYQKCCGTDQRDFAVARYNTNGSLDKSFGADGKQFTNFGVPNADNSPDIAYSVAIQKDGKIIVLGIADQYLAIARYNSDGSADSTFDNDGKLINDQLTSAATSLAIQDNGKILVGGSIKGDFAILRYNADGSLDHTFSDDGIQTTDFNPVSAGISSLAIESDGKIVAGGSTLAGNPYAHGFAIARYNIDGSPDKSFSVDGKLTTDVGHSYGLQAIALQSNGKIVAVGDSSGNAFLLIRYNVNGSLDKSFSNDGKQVTPFGINTSGNQAYTVAIQANGKIVAGGSAYPYFAIARYNNDGSLDHTFDKDGKLTDGNLGKNTVFKGTAIQKDGKIIAAGRTWNGSNYDFALARYNTDGSLDKSFAKDGAQTTDFGSADDYANSTAIQSDGKIVVAGYSGRTDSSKFSIVRYNTDGSLDNSFDNDGKRQDDFGSKINEVYSVVIQNDGKIVVAGGTQAKDNDGYDITVFAIARYNADGSLDKTFDQDGKQTIAGQQSYATSVAVQDNGKIFLAGLNPGYNAFSSFALLNTNGSVEKQGSGASDAVACAMALQKSGKIVMATYFSYRGDNGIQIARYNADGSPDTSFNGTGRVVTPLESWSSDVVNSVAIQNDNKIVVGGTKLFRYNMNGSIDSTFEIDGVQSAVFKINDITISGNKLYAVGGANYGTVAKYLLDSQNTPPTVSLTTPTNNTTCLAPASHIKLSAAAADKDGTITKVEFYNGTTLLHTETAAPYGYVWRNVGLGNYTITAKAYDNSGNVTTSDPVHIPVVPNKPPVVSFIKPSNNQSYAAPAYIHFEAAASDTDGRITRVELYNGTTLLNTQYQAPYTYNWQYVPAGTYTITAVAVDNWAARTTSAPVTIRIKPTPATIVSNKAGNNKTNISDVVSLTLSPNPAANVLNISAEGLQLNKPVTISVISCSGVVMKTMQTTNSTKVVQFDVSRLINGVYTVKLICADKVSFKQFVKM